MILLALATDAKDLENFRNQPSVTGAIKFIAEIPIIVLPKNMGQVMIFAEQIGPLIAHLKKVEKMTGQSTFSAMMFEVELNK